MSSFGGGKIPRLKRPQFLEAKRFPHSNGYEGSEINGNVMVLSQAKQAHLRSH